MKLALAGSAIVFVAVTSATGMVSSLSQDDTSCFSLRSKAKPGNVYEVFYHHSIKNATREKLKNVRVYLTVPPDDDGQRIEGFRVETFGNDLEVSDLTDEYGNKLRKIVIAGIDPGEEVEVGFSCEVRLWNTEKVVLNPEAVGSLKDIPAEIVNQYSRNHQIFGLDTDIIRAKAARFKRDHSNLAKRVLAIHDLVAERIEYHRDGPWDAAPVVLERGTGSCSEFSHVFCALCRASGIPTRFVGASALNKKTKLPYRDKVWHRWAEVYLPGLGWVPFDVTKDRGKPPKRTFAGKRPANMLVVTRKGDSCKPLGHSYLSSNSHYKQVKRERYFVWSQGTYGRFQTAKRLVDGGRRQKGIRALKALVEDSPGTRGAVEAEKLIEELEGNS